MLLFWGKMKSFNKLCFLLLVLGHWGNIGKCMEMWRGVHQQKGELSWLPNWQIGKLVILSNKLEKLIIVVSSELVMTNPSEIRAGELVISNKLEKMSKWVIYNWIKKLRRCYAHVTWQFWDFWDCWGSLSSFDFINWCCLVLFHTAKTATI